MPWYPSKKYRSEHRASSVATPSNPSYSPKYSRSKCSWHSDLGPSGINHYLDAWFNEETNRYINRYQKNMSNSHGVYRYKILIHRYRYTDMYDAPPWWGSNRGGIRSATELILDAWQCTWIIMYIYPTICTSKIRFLGQWEHYFA